jgi:hypothetical protein
MVANLLKKIKDTYLLNPHPENEHVGVDKEGMYSDPKAVADDDVSKSNTDSDYESTSDECYSDEEVKDHEPPNKPVFVYDKNDPPMAVEQSMKTSMCLGLQ